jgi:transposase-like protein
MVQPKRDSNKPPRWEAYPQQVYYLAIGINLSEIKEVLSACRSRRPRREFRVANHNGTQESWSDRHLHRCVGLKGIPETIETVFPTTQMQLCMVPSGRPSLNYIG